MSKKVYIYRNNKEASIAEYDNLLSLLDNGDWEILEEYNEEQPADLLICIGGDGTFLSFAHKCRFPNTPILGINTGHLGFFQECKPADVEKVLNNFLNDDYTVQNIKPVEAKIVTEGSTFTRIGINEILIRGMFSHVSHYAISIGNTKVQDFSGDGVLISTPVGSTAYNYSLDGSLVSPDLDVLQLTPVAPMNTNPYRCFHSSILLPASDKITIEGTGRSKSGSMMVSFDGRTHDFTNVKYVEITQSDKEIHLIRSSEYDYWSKLSSKLL